MGQIRKAVLGRRKSSHTVMVVHPSEFVSVALASGLAAKGYRVFPLGSATQALSALEATRVDLVVIAWDDTEMGRLGLLKNLRENPRFEHLPVVVWAPDPTHLDVFDAYHLGADIVLDSDELASAIAAIDYLLNPV